MAKNKQMKKKRQQWTYAQQQNFVGNAGGIILAGLIFLSMIAIAFSP